ncbi:MAG: RagB/SusD family nutrient uptake outer membrane protein [Mediterranea sp.]|nr:RagB/SusD family nutrient uptake outer membrane protein [Mediterranea sp.]
MKGKRNISYLALLVSVTLATALSGCSDEFLKEKKVYGSYDANTVYENYDAAKSRIDYLYTVLLPATPGSSNAITDLNSGGGADDFSRTTEEYGGFSVWNDATVPIIPAEMPDYFFVRNDPASPWGRIRECNDVIAGLRGSVSIPEEDKNLLLGQALFFRAWRYYLLVKLYGGVPIITEVQNPVIGSGDGSEKVVPRSSTKACVDFICQDLSEAARLLPFNWAGGDYGRITAGAALALKGRMLLLYASPLFNRADEEARWQAAYQANKNAVDTLQAGGFGSTDALANTGNNAEGWAKMFANYTGGSEAVFVTLYNNVTEVTAQNVHKNNLWEQNIRPQNINGAASLRPTSEMVDLFPMSDGLRPGVSSIPYDTRLFFMNRDPRFYRTFSFPGVEWKFNSGTISSFASSARMSSLCPPRYDNGGAYQLWSYNWYDTADNREDETKSGYAADWLGNSNYSVYLRKRSDDATDSQLLRFNDLASGNQYGFRTSAAPFMEIRYGEVLLNLAEAACGANHFDEALAALQEVRERVGYTAENNYGLDPAINSNRAALFSAILYERQVELAYEGKRAYDMRRWMLYDGGEGQGAINPSWELTGFGRNTCDYLGVTPMNNLGKRHRIEVYVEQTAALNNNSDPIVGNTDMPRPAALTLTEPIVSTTDGEGNVVVENARVKGVYDYYNTYFKRKDIRLDGNNVEINP